jgi:asparagine synthase (glutamine-hydrolysing)
MCGIAGVMVRSPYDAVALAARLGERLHHRGPDDQGSFSDLARGVALCHCRLSVIDLSPRGRQPIANETGRLHLLVNGEIYNYRELRSELQRAGHRFFSQSDSETILHGYEEWGEEVFPRLRGMYAVALYDQDAGMLVLARDPLGIKPLYLLTAPWGLAFASETRAFQALPASLWRFELDEDRLDRMLRFQYLPDREGTLLKGITKVPPGTCLICRADGTRASRVFWTLRADPRVASLTFEEAVNECEALLTQSVEWTLNADVPVGVLLSGGLDSSLVAALASRGGRPITTYTASFDHVLNESDAAERVARHLGSHHVPVFIEAAEVHRRFDELVPVYDDLTSFDGGLFTLVLLAEKIRERGIKVLLFGDGADELFAGYSWYGLCQYPWRCLPLPMRAALMYYGMTRMLPGWARWRDVQTVSRAFEHSGDRDVSRQVGWYEMMIQLPNHFNMKTDKAISSRGLEGRVPYLDHRLAEFAFSLPAAFKMKGRWFRFSEANEKHILRAVAARHLPPETAHRKKRGFLVPVAEILKANLANVRERLLDPQSLARRYFSPAQIERMLAFRTVLYSPIEKQKEFLVWKFFLLESWLRSWKDRPQP